MAYAKKGERSMEEIKSLASRQREEKERERAEKRIAEIEIARKKIREIPRAIAAERAAIVPYQSLS